jgi:hypothetical protein
MIILPYHLFGENWKFVKKKDNVEIFTKKEDGKSLKHIKGVAEIMESSENVFALIEDVNHTDWWDSNLREIKVLLYEKNKRAQYYLVYDMPWPFNDRDLYVNVTTTINQATGECKISAVPLKNNNPESKNLIRIKDYQQVWTVRPLSKNRTHIELDFYVNAVENLPDWLLNLIFIDSPINSINAVKKILEKK